MFETIKTLFFDYDGTLHNSIKIYAPAFRCAYKYLVDQGVAQTRVWEDAEIAKWLGYNKQDMWQLFMPDLDPLIRDEASSLIGKEMNRLIAGGEAELYEGAIDTLSYLKSKGYRLVFISNCSTAYRDAASDMFNLPHYFELMICSEAYGYIPKHEILSNLLDNYPGESIIIGDRYQDIEAGLKNHIKCIGCSYGYGLEGELDEADLVIDDIRELKDIL
jgi:phosphoglycolate phosphatase